MVDKDIYALTKLGEREVRGGETTASPQELDLLVRIDGVLTLEQIKAGMKPASAGDVDRTFRLLADKGWIAPRESDPFADQFSFKPSKSALRNAEAEADAGAASLQKAGYFVRIARKGRQHEEGRELSALVVEDDPHLAKFLQHYLQFEGFVVRIAGARAEIVAELRKAPPPDLVLLDVTLPDADGFDILLKMRAHPALQHVPVVMLTAKATREAVLQGLAAGAQGYVTKPFEADALLQAVRTVMGLPQEPGDADGADAAWPGRTR